MPQSLQTLKKSKQVADTTTTTMMEKSSNPSKITSKVLYSYNPGVTDTPGDDLKKMTDQIVELPEMEEDLESGGDAVAAAAVVEQIQKVDNEQPSSPVATEAQDLSETSRSKSEIVSGDENENEDCLQEVDLEATNKADDAMVPIPSGDEDDLELEEPDISVSYPKAFYCPLTNKILEDPVVLPDGNSYEREVILQDETASGQPISDDMVYPNRALKLIIDDARSRQGDSLQANLKRMQHNVSQRLGQLLEMTPIDVPTSTLSDAFYCPITFNLMWDPVIDPEGNTFERVAAENWIRFNKNSPITRTELTVEQLYPNTAIYDLLQEEKEKPEELMDPAIRKWKEETPPVASDPEVGGNLEHQATYGEYPTTFSELDQRQAARRRTIMNFFGIMFAILCLVGFVMYGGLILLMLFVVTLMLVFSRNRGDPRR